MGRGGLVGLVKAVRRVHRFAPDFAPLPLRYAGPEVWVDRQGRFLRSSAAYEHGQ